MAYTNDEINQWLTRNAGASDEYIGQVMQNYGVNIGDVIGAVNEAGGSGAGLMERWRAATGRQGHAGRNDPFSKDGQATPGAPAPANNPLTFQQNPYLPEMAKVLQGQFNDNLTMNTLPALRGGAVAAGGVGGSRQGIAEGLAAAESNKGFGNALTGMYYGDYNNQMNRDLQKYGMDQQYTLGNKGLDNSFYLGNQGQLQDFWTAQRGQDLQSIGLGAQLYGNGVSGEWGPIQQATSAYSPWSGYGSTTNTDSGTNWGAAIGNGLGTYQAGKTNGWW